MANQEQVEILRRGVEEWNEYVRGLRLELSHRHLDLSGAELHSASLPGIDLRNVVLIRTDLSGADLSGADLRGVNLIGADLGGAELMGACVDGATLPWARLAGANLANATLLRTNLIASDLTRCKLTGATLTGASLSSANLTEACFVSADLARTNLFGSNFNHANLSHTNLIGATLGDTIFSGIDLSQTLNLSECIHDKGSAIDFETLSRSWPLPEVFLRGVGLPDQYIEQLPALIGALEPIQFYSCFISHSSKDDVFVSRLHNDLQAKGIRTWYAPEDLKIGGRFHARIEEAIRIYDKLLLVLSKNSVNSAWVEREVLAARDRQDKGEQVLFPIVIDDAFEDVDAPWAKDIGRQIQIGDFRGWDKDIEIYGKGFERLVRDLKKSAETERNR